MLRLIILALALLTFLTMGFICIVFPKQYQRWVVERGRRSRIHPLNPFPSFYEARWFPVILRLSGLVSLGMFFLVLWLLMTGHRP
jgi:uncharacterized protein YjeT (DUF2065 family)